MTYCIYDTTNGAILRAGFSAETQISATGEGELSAWGNDTTQYIDTAATGGPAIVARPASTAALATGSDVIAADDVEIASVTGCPTGSTYRITGPVAASGSVTGGTLEFSTDTPGAYRVDVYSFPELDTSFEVTAT